MPKETTSPIRYFVPGPAFVRREVREAMTREIAPHRSPPMVDLYESLGRRLQEVFRTGHEVLIATSSSTLIMESALISTVDSRVLNLTNGAFSERWHAIARALGKDADRVSVPWGQPVDPALVREALRRHRYDAVTIVHNETSTGVMNPLAELAETVKQESDALILVDAVSSLAGAPIETDDWDLDLVLAGSQKALAVPPGLTVFSLSERAAKQAAAVEHRGFYTDVLRYLEKHRGGGPITTPAIPILFALDCQLDHILAEGLERRWQRHQQMAERVQRWVEESGGRLAAADGFRSRTLTCLAPREGVAATDLVAAAGRLGWTVAGGYGDWKSSTLRIGHMGDVGLDDLEVLISVLEGCLVELEGSS